MKSLKSNLLNPNLIPNARRECPPSRIGLNNLEREAATTDLHQDIVLTASSADTKILAGSFMYFHAGNNTDVMTVKCCLRTTGGTIAVTTAN